MRRLNYVVMIPTLASCLMLSGCGGFWDWVDGSSYSQKEEKKDYRPTTDSDSDLAAALLVSRKDI